MEKNVKSSCQLSRIFLKVLSWFSLGVDCRCSVKNFFVSLFGFMRGARLLSTPNRNQPSVITATGSTVIHELIFAFFAPVSVNPKHRSHVDSYDCFIVSQLHAVFQN